MPVAACQLTGPLRKDGEDTDTQGGTWRQRDGDGAVSGQETLSIPPAAARGGEAPSPAAALISGL